MECLAGLSNRPSLSLDVRCPDYLRPFFGFIGDELAEIGRRPCNHRTAHFGEARPDSWIGERLVDFPVELVDDLRWCTLRSADPKKCTRLVARHELAHCGVSGSTPERTAVVTARTGSCPP